MSSLIRKTERKSYVLMGLATLMVFFGMMFAFTQPAYAVTVDLGDVGEGSLGDAPSSGEVERQGPNTGGSDSKVDYAERCGFISSKASSDGFYYQNCSQRQYEYYAISADDNVFLSTGASGNSFISQIQYECAFFTGPGGRPEREGNGRTWVGASITVRSFWTQYYSRDSETNRPIYVGVGSSGGYEVEDINCVYQYWEDLEDIVCVVSIDLRLNKVAGTSGLGRILNERATTPWGQGNATVAACNNSRHLTASTSKNLSEFGRYQGDTEVRFQRITVRTYDNAPAGHARPADEIIRIHPVTSRPGPNVYAQVTCDPQHTGVGTVRSQVWTGGPWSWTFSDCEPGVPTPGAAAYQCVNADTATLNGRSGVTSATIFRDADDNRITWNDPTISSSNLVSVTPKDTRVTRSGTPWNTPRVLPVGNNNVTLKTPGGTNVLARGNSWIGGRQDDFLLTANWASNAGDPTVIRPVWRYDAVINTRAVQITGLSVSYSGGSWSISPRWRNITVPASATATCRGEITLDVVRAVNDS